MAKTASSSTVVVKNLRLPETLYDSLSERALKHGRSVEDEIFIRSPDCRDHTSDSPIYLDDATRAELCKLSGRLLKTPADLLTWIRSLTDLKVNGVDISLGQQLVTRLESRRFGKTWKELLQTLVPEKLEEHVGMR